VASVASANTAFSWAIVVSTVEQNGAKLMQFDMFVGTNNHQVDTLRSTTR
jgi:hypothetical protein